MTSAASEADPVLQWFHGADGGQLWLAVTVPATGTVVLTSDAPGAPRDEVPLSLHDEELRPGRHHLSIAVADLPARTGSAEGPWVLALATPRATRRFRCPGSPEGYETDITVETDGTGWRLRTSVGASGDARFRLEERRAWAEVGTMTIEGSELRLHGRLAGARESAVATGISAVLTDRTTKCELVAPARREGGSFAIDLDLSILPDDATTWDASLRTDDQTYRLGRHLDDVPGKHRAVVTPVLVRRGPSTSCSVHPRFTDRNNVSITVSGPLEDDAVQDPRETWTIDHSELLSRQPPPSDEALRTDRIGGLMARALIRTLAWAWDRRRPWNRRRTATGRDVHLLLATRHAIGGTVRATVNLANGLAAHTDRQVHLVSVYQLEELEPFLPAADVDATVLANLMQGRQPDGRGPRAWLRRNLLAQPTQLIPAADQRAYRFNLWTDLVLLRWLRSLDGGTIVTTRSGLSIAASRYARSSCRIVAQQHLPLEHEPPELQATLLEAYRRCDAIAVLTNADARLLRGKLGSAAPPIRIVPNSLDAAVPPPRAPVPGRLLCAGRVSPVKGTDLLLLAFAHIADRHPNHELRIVGPARRDRLAAAKEIARESGIADRVRFPAATPRVEAELAAAELCIVPSRHEAFGMIIIEAMRSGTPVIAFDCPSGPAELITDGVDGLLVPAEDVESLADAMTSCIEDEHLRASLAEAGRRTAQRYQPEAVASTFTALLADLEND